MRKLGIINPAAGQGDAAKYVNTVITDGLYVTKCIGDAESFVCSECMRDPHTHFFIYGGDGTVNEAVNGIMRAGANESALISVIPVGTGNDLVRSFGKSNIVHNVDVMRYNGRYAINVINFGFDCDTVKRAGVLKTKPLISGSTAYILGAAAPLASSYGMHLKLQYTLENGEKETAEGDYLLCTAANCRFYGGGFLPAPTADCSDGIMDVTAVKKISRRRFASLVLDYKAGRHVDMQTGRPTERFKDVMDVRRCRSFRAEGMRDICVDGEIVLTEKVEIDMPGEQIRIMI